MNWTIAIIAGSGLACAAIGAAVSMLVSGIRSRARAASGEIQG